MQILLSVHEMLQMYETCQEMQKFSTGSNENGCVNVGETDFVPFVFILMSVKMFPLCLSDPAVAGFFNALKHFFTQRKNTTQQLNKKALASLKLVK